LLERLLRLADKGEGDQAAIAVALVIEPLGPQHLAGREPPQGRAAGVCALKYPPGEVRARRRAQACVRLAPPQRGRCRRVEAAAFRSLRAADEQGADRSEGG
jgi:hypothetical protein